ncbi:glycosyltransferase family 4 protein [Sphingopyxis terrae]|uniref:glycosyltransferase family 4 protein n=1 Tax=Sphingopyxis terrae TaxID=33052 RepID=UPI0009EDC6DF|nr:glycosyltransferase family 1 protein [Sphingopyxis terrae]
MDVATRAAASAPFRQVGNAAPACPADLGPHAGEPHRVALFSGNFNCVRDGANRALNRLVAHTLERGHAVRVYSPTVARPAFPPAGALVSVPSWPIPFRPEYRYAPGLPRAIAHDVRRFAPTLVHVSAPDGLGAAAIRLARAIGVPVVASVHTRFETYLEYYGLRRLRGVAEAWLRRFYGRCDAVLVPSMEVAKQLAGIGIEATHIWSRGIDPEEFHPSLRDMGWRRSVGIADHELALLFFGRLVAEKGCDAFATTIAALRNAGIPVRPLIVGDGPERLRLARRLPDAVFTGHLAGFALGRAVASADILLNPSLTETFGNVTLEAMASGLPVVAADVPVNRVLIECGRSGLLVSPGLVPAYSEGVRRLIAEPDLRRTLSDGALASAMNFNWSRTLNAVLRAYGNASVTPVR